MQKNVGSMLALYPTPVTVVGVKTEEKVNWLHITISTMTKHIVAKMEEPYESKQ